MSDTDGAGRNSPEHDPDRRLVTAAALAPEDLACFPSDVPRGTWALAKVREDAAFAGPWLGPRPHVAKKGAAGRVTVSLLPPDLREARRRCGDGDLASYIRGVLRAGPGYGQRAEGPGVRTPPRPPDPPVAPSPQQPSRASTPVRAPEITRPDESAPVPPRAAESAAVVVRARPGPAPEERPVVPGPAQRPAASAVGAAPPVRRPVSDSRIAPMPPQTTRPPATRSMPAAVRAPNPCQAPRSRDHLRATI